LQCSNHRDVLGYYEELADTSYEEGRAQRSLQQRKLLEVISPNGQNRRLLDIGAGSGMLVEQALKLGYRAEGVEPSGWLQQCAQKLGLQVHRGIFPNPATPGPYEIVTLVDVIEHVPNPVELLEEIGKILTEDGVVLIVTPDAGSLIARMLGWRWWHYRLAHIGYFNRNNLTMAIKNAGLEPVRWGRPSWYFQADYLVDRVLTYLPQFLRWKQPDWLKKFTIPLNLGDSFFVLCKPQKSA
jgi:SAM-dependent methyltransferase